MLNRWKYLLILVITMNIGAKEINILEYDETNNAVQVIIKSDGVYCTAKIKDSNIYESNCLQLTNSNNISILCTKHKEICKTKSELLDAIVQEFSSTAQAMQDLQAEHMQEKQVVQTPVAKSKPKQTTNERVSSVVDFRLDYKDLDNKITCVEGKIYSDDDDVWMHDLSNADSSISLDISSLSRDFRKEVMVKCTIESMCNVVACGNVKYLESEYLKILHVSQIRGK